MVDGPDKVPEPESPVWADWAQVDLIFVPAVAFDEHGRRLGRGRGYYDQILRQRREAGGDFYSVGLAFDFQILPAVPVEDWDECVDLVITEARCIRR